MDLTEKIGKVVIQVRQNLALFSRLVSITLSWNCVKSLIVTKIVSKLNSEGACGKSEAKHCPQPIMDKIYETNASFNVK